MKRITNMETKYDSEIKTLNTISSLIQHNVSLPIIGEYIDLRKKQIADAIKVELQAMEDEIKVVNSKLQASKKAADEIADLGSELINSFNTTLTDIHNANHELLSCFDEFDKEEERAEELIQSLKNLNQNTIREKIWKEINKSDPKTMCAFYDLFDSWSKYEGFEQAEKLYSDEEMIKYDSMEDYYKVVLDLLPLQCLFEFVAWSILNRELPDDFLDRLK